MKKTLLFMIIIGLVSCGKFQLDDFNKDPQGIADQSLKQLDKKELTYTLTSPIEISGACYDYLSVRIGTDATPLMRSWFFTSTDTALKLDITPQVKTLPWGTKLYVHWQVVCKDGSWRFLPNDTLTLAP